MDGPADRCGATYADERAHSGCCYRETWGDRERCVWHATVADETDRPASALRAARADPETREANRGDGSPASGAPPAELLDGADLAGTTAPDGLDLSGVSLRDAALDRGDFREADLRDADLRDATLTEAELRDADLSGADCWDADFTGAHLTGADLSSADLTEAECSNATFRGADLSGATLEGATMDQADLFDADLREVRWYGALFGSARVNDGTELDERCVYDPDAATTPAVDADAPDHGVGADRDPLTRAASTYQELEQLCSENALLEEQSRYFVRRQDIHTTEHREAGRWGRWLRARGSRAVVLYGESPFRVLGVAGAVIVGSALLYPLGLLRDGSSGDLVTYPPPSEPAALAGTLADSLYFSTLSFTTMTYGHFVPVGAGRFLTMVETAAGVILIALLVFVFGRRATR